MAAIPQMGTKNRKINHNPQTLYKKQQKGLTLFNKRDDCRSLALQKGHWLDIYIPAKYNLCIFVGCLKHSTDL